MSAAEFKLQARNAILKVAQFTSFHDEISHLKKGKSIPGNPRLATLSPFIDENGLLRVGGRLSNSDFWILNNGIRLRSTQRTDWQKRLFETSPFGCATAEWKEL